MSRLKIAALLVGFGIVVGSVVGAMASVTGAAVCGAGEAGAECYELVRTLAIRVGLLTGGATVLMLLLVAGLMRMLVQDDHQRAEQAMEAYRRSREREAPGEAPG